MKGNDNSWKGFKTFIGIVLIIIQILGLLVSYYNTSLTSNCNLRCFIHLDYGIGGFLYFLGYYSLTIIGLIFLYLENKKMTNLIRYILIIILTIGILSILGF